MAENGSMKLVTEKIRQAVAVLDELGVDLWLTLCREADATPDPVTELIVGQHVIWPAAFFICRSGATVALVGSADAPDYLRAGTFQEVVVYGQDVGAEVRAILQRFDPARIAVNYSTADVTADGLSHGLYLQLAEWLAATPYAARLVSAEDIIARVRGRKTPREQGLLRTSAELAGECWAAALGHIRPGMSEIEVARMLEEQIAACGGTPSFGTIANAGAKTAPGHGSPTAALLEPGDLLHVDFGLRHEGYCSDIQRLAYVTRPGESAPPAELQAAFDTVKRAIDATVPLYRTGALGFEIDAVARRVLTDAGYPEYDHGLGHQIGRLVHDGAAVVGPRWPRYGRLSATPLEAASAFTVELGIVVDGIGYAGLEEDLIVTDTGGRVISPRQTEVALL